MLRESKNSGRVSSAKGVAKAGRITTLPLRVLTSPAHILAPFEKHFLSERVSLIVLHGVAFWGYRQFVHISTSMSTLSEKITVLITKVETPVDHEEIT